MQGLIAAVLVLTTAQDAPPKVRLSPETGEPQTLVVTYSDGRTNLRLLTPRGGSWTPNFPGQKSAPAQDGLPLAALQVDYVVERDVIVTVSLLYGSPHQRTVPVATARVKDAEPVQVNELRAFGVDPITLSIGVLSPALLVQPSATSASPLLGASVDLAVDDSPLYTITFRNHSTRAAMAIAFRMYRGGKEVGSGRRKTNRNTPIVDATGQYSFTFQAVGTTSLGFDRFEVTGVLWEDGSVEGDAELKSSEQALTIGYAQQLHRVLAILNSTVAADGSVVRLTSFSQIRSALEALPIESATSDPKLVAVSSRDPARLSVSIKIGQQQVKDAVLQDHHLRAHTGNAHAPVRPWAEAALARYSAWLDRTGGR